MLGTIVVLAAGLAASLAIAVWWSAVAMVGFVLATMWTNAVADVARHLVLPRVASNES